MKVLIIGAEGQVGMNLQKCFKENSFDYLAFNKNILDITQKQKVLSAVKNSKANIVVNAAAYTDVEKAEVDVSKVYAVNSDGPRNLAFACRKFSIPLIHISTDYVFDGKKDFPYHENDLTNPLNIYGKSKLRGEEEIKLLLNDYIILRTSWVFDRNGKNFMNTILDQCLKTSSLRVVGDQYGSPTSANSIAKVILIICGKYFENKHFRSGIYHFSGKDYVSWFQYAKKIAEIAFDQGLIDIKPVLEEIKSNEYPSKSIKPMYSCLSCSKIKDHFGIEPNNWQEDLRIALSSHDTKK